MSLKMANGITSNENRILLWSLVIGAIIFAIPIIITISLLSAPDRFENATVVKICRDGTKVFRMEDGEYRVPASSSGWRSFHADGPDICAP